MKWFSKQIRKAVIRKKLVHWADITIYDKILRTFINAAAIYEQQVYECE